LSTLRALVVDDDASVLNTCCSWLIDAGCEVTTQRTARNVLHSVKRAHAEVVLIDPLMQGLIADELVLLLTRCRYAGASSVILHSRLSAQMLRVILDPRDARGVIRKGGSGAEFIHAFRTLMRLDGAQPANSLRSPATSGTHRLGEFPGQVVPFPLNGGTRRRP
jgi:DNA-binding response OmpR family regulator